MENKLENYLDEIDHYLVVPTGVTEILLEIKSHILEKTEEKNGNIKPENIEKTIAEYGSPRKIAEKYLEGTHIIALSFRNYLFRYTWILFAFHFGLVALLLYFITQSKKDIKLPWPKFIATGKEGEKLQPPQPKIIYLLL